MKNTTKLLTFLLLILLVTNLILIIKEIHQPKIQQGYYYSNENGEIIAYPINKFHISDNSKYELSVNQEYYTLFENDRDVVIFKWGENPVLDSIILADNL